MIEIKTNRHERQFAYREEVPESVLLDQFDWQNPDEYIDGFFCYRGYWYHLSDFMRIDHDENGPFAGWDGVASDSYFSGVLIAVSDDGETYRVGTYIQTGSES